MSKVLLIDGPLEGQHRDWPLREPIQHWEITGGPGAGVYGQRVTEYTVHTLVVFGRLMRFGTCTPEVDLEAHNRVFWGRLATGFARDMAGPPEPPGPPQRVEGSVTPAVARLIEAAIEWDHHWRTGGSRTGAEGRLREAVAALCESGETTGS